MIAGLLNKRITIEKGITGTTSVLSAQLTYEPYMIVWANVYVRAGNSLYGESEELEYTTEFTIRYNSKSKEINNKYRILYNGQYYRIREIIETEYKHALRFVTVGYGEQTV